MMRCNILRVVQVSKTSPIIIIACAFGWWSDRGQGHSARETNFLNVFQKSTTWSPIARKKPSGVLGTPRWCEAAFVSALPSDAGSLLQCPQYQRCNSQHRRLADLGQMERGKSGGWRGALRHRSLPCVKLKPPPSVSFLWETSFLPLVFCPGVPYWKNLAAMVC